MSVPQWNADIITPASESGGTQVIGDKLEVQSTLESGTNITIEDGRISASGGGASYTAGTGITISEENAIAVTEAISNGAAAGATAVQPAALNDYALSSSLATVATSGSYADLSNKPSIPAAQVNSDWNAVSGVAQILNKPTIPTVDQNYNAASTNAQSGVAVAQAIAALPTPETITLGYKEF